MSANTTQISSCTGPSIYSFQCFISADFEQRKLSTSFYPSEEFPVAASINWSATNITNIEFTNFESTFLPDARIQAMNNVAKATLNRWLRDISPPAFSETYFILSENPCLTTFSCRGRSVTLMIEVSQQYIEEVDCNQQSFRRPVGAITTSQNSLPNIPSMYCGPCN
jgi:hypothetical protein